MITQPTSPFGSRLPGRRRTTPDPRHGGFSLVEVALALGLIGTVVLAMLALLAHGVETSGHVRRATLGVHIASQVQQALKGFRSGVDDTQGAAPGGTPGLLDEFLPFRFQNFPTDGKPPMVIGFDASGNKRGEYLYRDYETGTNQDDVAFLARLEGREVADNPGLTDVLVTIEHPAGEPARYRKRQEFRMLMLPGGELPGEGGRQ